jgi:hypothetical protein
MFAQAFLPKIVDIFFDPVVSNILSNPFTDLPAAQQSEMMIS